MLERWREVPPTAGLPLRWRDFTPRPSSPSLERTLAEFLNVPSVLLECSGTAALVIALTALKRASNRRNVVIPAYTCPLVPLAVLHCDLNPVLCDIVPGSIDFDAGALSRVCDSETLAVIATHLGGRVTNLDLVTASAQRCGAVVIEDAAQALGASWRGRKAGTVGDVGFFSLAAGKGLTLYEGGILVARDPAMSQVLREVSASIAPFRWRWELRRSLEMAGYAVAYRPLLLRLVYGGPLRRALRKGRLTEAVGDELSSRIPLHRVGSFRRAAGARAASRLPAFLEALDAQAMVRTTALNRIPGLRVVNDCESSRGTWPFFMVLMPTAGARDRALERLWTAGLGVTRLFIHALPDYKYLRPYVPDHHVPNARDFAARMLTISNSLWLSNDDFERICVELAAAVDAAH